MSDVFQIGNEHQIRRLDAGHWYWVDKAIIRQFAGKVGVSGIAVYNYLASLVNVNQICYPSQEKIAQVLGLSRTTVVKAIKSLCQHRLIAVDKSGRYPQRYRLLPVDRLISER